MKLALLARKEQGQKDHLEVSTSPVICESTVVRDRIVYVKNNAWMAVERVIQVRQCKCLDVFPLPVSVNA